MNDREVKHARRMTRRLIEVFDADFLPGGYGNPRVPWWIAGESYMRDHGKTTSRTGKLLDSEIARAKRERAQMDDAREAMGMKRRGKAKKVKDRIR